MLQFQTGAVLGADFPGLLRVSASWCPISTESRLKLDRSPPVDPQAPKFHRIQHGYYLTIREFDRLVWTTVQKETNSSVNHLPTI